MNKLKIIFLLITFSFFSFINAQERIGDFKLTNDSTYYSSIITDPYIVIFFLEKECPFVYVYNERIKAIKETYPQYHYMIFGDYEVNNIQNFIQNRSLKIELGIHKSPTTVVLKNQATGFSVIYKGPIDDNPQLEKQVTNKHLEKVLKNPIKQSNKLYVPGCVIH